MDKATTSSIDTIAKTCIAVRLRLLNRVVTNIYDEALRMLGLKVSHHLFDALSARGHQPGQRLGRLGQKQPTQDRIQLGVDLREVASEFLVDLRSSLKELVDVVFAESHCYFHTALALNLIRWGLVDTKSFEAF